MAGAGATDEDVTEDRLYGGRLTLRQPKRGYRMNLDTVLLGASVAGADGAVLEAGCGVGGALLCAAKRFWETHPAMRFVGVESEPDYAALARANVITNGMGARVEIVEGDALDFVAARNFAGVFFNPPYEIEGKGRPPLPERRAAHVAREPLDQWIARLSNALSGGAWMTMIHRAERLSDILGAMEGRLGGVEIIPIRPRAGEAASRVIVRGRKGSRAPLTIAEEIVLHDASGAKHTLRAEAILRGEAAIREA